MSSKNKKDAKGASKSVDKKKGNDKNDDQEKSTL